MNLFEVVVPKEAISHREAAFVRDTTGQEACVVVGPQRAVVRSDAFTGRRSAIESRSVDLY
jgi:hypothetical protein